MIKLAENLKVLRKEKKLSQEELADVFGITSQSVSKWELGLSCPDITLLPEIAEYFGVSIDQLLGYKPSSTVNSIYLEMRALVDKEESQSEKQDLTYRLARLASITMWNQELKEVDKLVKGVKTHNLSYGQGYGGLSVTGENSLFISTFKNMPTYDITTIRRVYKYINKLADMNTLKVLFSLFNMGITNSLETVTLDEVAEKTELSNEEVLKAMNNLDIYFDETEYNKTGIEKYSLAQYGQVPMLVTLLIPSLDSYGQNIRG